MRLIRNIKRTPANAASLKMAHFSNIGVTEVFLEATPTTFITTVLLLTAMHPDQTNKGIRNVLIGSESNELDELLLVGYTASILSAAFGVSR